MKELLRRKKSQLQPCRGAEAGGQEQERSRVGRGDGSGWVFPIGEENALFKAKH